MEFNFDFKLPSNTEAHEKLRKAEAEKQAQIESERMMREDIEKKRIALETALEHKNMAPDRKEVEDAIKQAFYATEFIVVYTKKMPDDNFRHVDQLPSPYILNKLRILGLNPVLNGTSNMNDYNEPNNGYQISIPNPAFYIEDLVYPSDKAIQESGFDKSFIDMVFPRDADHKMELTRLAKSFIESEIKKIQKNPKEKHIISYSGDGSVGQDDILNALFVRNAMITAANYINYSIPRRWKATVAPDKRRCDPLELIVEIC